MTSRLALVALLAATGCHAQPADTTYPVEVRNLGGHWCSVIANPHGPIVISCAERRP